MSEAPVYKMPLSEIVASNVRAESGRRGISQAGLARYFNTTRTTINARWMNRVSWSLDELQALAEIFDLSVTDLFNPESVTDIANPAHLKMMSGNEVRREGIEPPTRWLRVKLASTCDNVVDLNTWKQSQTLKAVGQ